MPELTSLGQVLVDTLGVGLEANEPDKDGPLIKDGETVEAEVGTVLSKAKVTEFLAGSSPSLYITPDVAQFMKQTRALTFANPTTTITLDGARVADATGASDCDSLNATLMVDDDTDIVWANVISVGLVGELGLLRITNDGGGTFAVDFPDDQPVVVQLADGVTNPGLGTGDGDVMLVQYRVLSTSLIELVAFTGGSSAPTITNAGTITSASLGKIGTSHTVTGFAFSGTGSETYQWYRGASPIGGATSAAYTPVSADDLTNLSRRTTVTGGSGSDSADTPTQAITYPAPVITNDGTVAAASHLGKVGREHTVSGHAVTGTVSSTTYQWYSGSTAITGATSASFIPTSAEEGTNLKRRTTVTNSGGSDFGDTNTQAITYQFEIEWCDNNATNSIIYSGSAYSSDTGNFQVFIAAKRMTDNPAAFCRLYHNGSRTDISLNSQGKLRVILRDNAGTLVVDWLSTSAVDVAGEWIFNVAASLGGTPSFTAEKCERVAGVMGTITTIPGTFTTGPIAGSGSFDHNRTATGNDTVWWGTSDTPPVNIPDCDFGFATVSHSAPVAFSTLVDNGVLLDPLTALSPLNLVRGPAANLVNDEGSADLTLVATGWTDTV